MSLFINPEEISEGVAEGSVKVIVPFREVGDFIPTEFTPLEANSLNFSTWVSELSGINVKLPAESNLALSAAASLSELVQKER